MADDIKTQIDWYSSHGMMQGELDPAKVANTDPPFLFWRKV